MAKPYVKVAILQQVQPIVDGKGRPTAAFLRLINDNGSNLAGAINAVAVLPIIQEALEQAQQAAQDATEAAAMANEAAAVAQQQTEAAKREAALQGSYIEPSSVLTASPTLITIAPHTRRYADGSSVSVSGGTVAATASGDVDYVFYSDPMRAGSSVTYIASTAAPVQTGDTHVVGAVTIPATGTADGGEGPQRPGFVRPRTDAEVLQ